MNDEMVDYVNQQLEALAESLPSSFGPSLNVYLTASSFTEKTEEAEGLIFTLSQILSSCSADFAACGNCSDIAKVFDALSSIGYFFSIESCERLFDASVYLIAELQSCIMAGNIPIAENNSNEAMDIDDSEKPSMDIDNDTTGRIAIQLDKICRLLKIDSSSANNSLDVIALVKSCIDQVVATHPHPEQILHPETILPSSTKLTDAQKATQQHLEEAFQQDFAIRRQMMLTRFEVTLESLLGEDEETVDEEDETARVRAAIKAQLKSIKRQPFFYRWEDALQAPVAIFYEQGKKVTGDTYSSAGSVVKKVIVGPVPDRGGRVNELRQKKVFEEKRHGGGRHNHNNNFHKNKQQRSGKINSNRNEGGGSQSNKQANANNNIGSNNSSSNTSGRIVTMNREEKTQEEHQRKKGKR